MKDDIKKKWVKALRSGEYVQGWGQLRKKGDDSYVYCCLGVLVDILSKESPDLVHWDGEKATTIMESEKGTLPHKVWVACELVSEDPDVRPPNKIKSSLVCLNDGGYSFEEIADIIEEQL